MKINEVVQPLDLDYDKIAKDALGDYTPNVRFPGSGPTKKQKASAQQARIEAGKPMIEFKNIINDIFPEANTRFFNDRGATRRRLRVYFYHFPEKPYRTYTTWMKNNEADYLQAISQRMTDAGYTVQKIDYLKPQPGTGWYSSMAGYPAITIWIDPEY
jgi:hypothetical protein